VFNLSGSEVVIILIIALVVLGPDKLPDFMRRAGRTWGELKKLSSGFQEEVRKGFEDPAKEVKQTADAVRKAAAFPKSVGTEAKKLVYNPLKDKQPELPEGESVAEPDPDEVDTEPADASTAEPTDSTTEPADASTTEPADEQADVPDVEPADAPDTDPVAEQAQASAASTSEEPAAS
jgi:sec-independent protein translocase protein TatB